MNYQDLLSLRTHPRTVAIRRFVRRAVMTCAVILAVAVVTTVTVDLGPALRRQAEAQGSRFIQRPMRIGKLSVLLWNGTFRVEDLVIEGLTPASQPFLTARRIDVSMPWRTLFDRRIVFDGIEMTDWRMHVERLRDGSHNFPRFTRERAPGPRRWTTTLQYVRAHRGEFVFQDHGTPWGIVARNLDVSVMKPADRYTGTASFSDGLVAIQNYVPFRADMTSSFAVDGGRVIFDAINLETDGATSVLNGDVDLSRFPEQMFRLRSTYDFKRMRELFFAQDNFTLSGTGQFDGTFHLFRETMPDGQTRTSRELKGTFESDVAGVDAFRFHNLRGDVRWTPDALLVTQATTDLYGGNSAFDFRMLPLGQPGVRTRARFDARYSSVDLATLMDALEVKGIRLGGTVSGRNLIEWPTGRGGFDQAQWAGDARFTPPAGVTVLARELSPIEDRGSGIGEPGPEMPFSPDLSLVPVPVAGQLSYTAGPEWIDIAPSLIATPDTYVAFEGRTGYGDHARLPFHVTSADWQESDRLLAGIMTAFDAPTRAIPIGGSGTFDGVLTNSFRRPRIEGAFAGRQMRAFDVVWGDVEGHAVIENSYADVTDAVIRAQGSRVLVGGRFSLGYPRRDGGEEINAVITLDRRPLADLKHAFELDDYDLDGTFSGQFHVFGHYTRPLGFGTMSITEGVAYTEPFETARASVLLEGNGVRLSDLQIVKGGGRGVGSAFVNWNGTYSFNLDARGIPVESVAAVKASPLPLSGVINFRADGTGSFDRPSYRLSGTIVDLFAGDEGIGEVYAEISIDDTLVTLAKLEAASRRLSVSGSGRMQMTPAMPAELAFVVSDTSLDPYVRALDPRLSPYTTAVVSGTVRVSGELANVDRLLVDVSVSQFDARLFDYAIRNASPVRLAFDRSVLRISEMRLVGQDTQLDVSGTVGFDDERIAIRANGDANLSMLQGFVANIRSSGRAILAASIEGSMRDPTVNGTLTMDRGRIRHFGLPHALEGIDGALRFDSRGVSLDGVTGRIAGGDVRFGGRVDKEGYGIGRLDVTMVGEAMRLRFPAGMSSTVDADLALQGNADAATLTGTVTVRDALYTRSFEATTEGLFDFGGAPAATAAGAPTSVPVRYSVRINVPSTLQVRNDTMRLLATADLELRGTYDRPLLFGRAEIIRGEITVEGRRYLVTRGSIDFNNPNRIVPFLDIEAETRVRVPGETYTVRVSAVGEPDRLQPTFDSDPPLPQIEVMSLLLGDIAPGRDAEFRRYSTDVTPQQQLFTERMTRALTGALSSEVGRVVEETFGVDTFRFTPSLNDPNQQSSRLDPSARVTIGTRLSERTYLTYSRSLSSATRDQIILLEYDQSDRLSWILSRNEDGTYALDFRIRRSF